MTDRKELVSRLLAYRTVIKALQDEESKLRDQAADLFDDVGEREVGILLDQRLGTVSLEAGQESWQVVDYVEFLGWVIKDFPGEIVTISDIRSSFRDAVLAKCKSEGAFYVNEETGEAFIPPGVGRRQSNPKLVARTDKHAGWVVRQHLGIEATKKLGIEA